MDGEDAVIVWPMEKWEEMDDHRNFAAEYEAVRGPGSWATFLNQLDDCIKGRVGWIRERVE